MCQLSIVSDKIINSDNFRIKSLSYSEKGAIVCVIYFVFTHFKFILKTCQIMWENFVFFDILDACYVVNNWSISLLPPSVLDNLFGVTYLYQLGNGIISYLIKWQKDWNGKKLFIPFVLIAGT